MAVRGTRRVLAGPLTVLVSHVASQVGPPRCLALLAHAVLYAVAVGQPLGASRARPRSRLAPGCTSPRSDAGVQVPLLLASFLSGTSLAFRYLVVVSLGISLSALSTPSTLSLSANRL